MSKFKEIGKEIKYEVIIISWDEDNGDKRPHEYYYDCKNRDEWEEVFCYGTDLFNEKKYSEAAFIFKGLIRTTREISGVDNSSLADTNLLLARSLREIDQSNEDNTEIEQYLREALRLKPDHQFAIQDLLFVLVYQSREAEAMEIIAKYENAITSNNDPQFIKYFLELLRIKINDKIKREPDFFEAIWGYYEAYNRPFYYGNFILDGAIFAGYYLKALTIIDNSISKVEHNEIIVNYLSKRLYITANRSGKAEMDQCLRECDSLFAKHEEGVSDEQIASYYQNRNAVLLKSGRVKEIEEVLSSLPEALKENTLLYNMAKTYLDMEEYDKAIRHAWAAIHFKKDELDYIVLGRAYMGKGEYENAIKMFIKAINFINKDCEMIYRAGDMDIVSITSATKEERLEDVYQYLIPAYVGNEEYVYAEATLQKLREVGGDPKAIIDSKMLISITQKIENQKQEVENAYTELTDRLSKSEEKVGRLKQDMSKWYDKLVKCQIWSEKEVSDDIWEDQISEKMNDVITTLSNFCIQKSSRSYNNVINTINKRFPKLSKEARNFLATAEQIYSTFEEEEMMDFAPVLVEYARFVETMLWQYLDYSPEYKEHAKKNKAYNDQGPTLGAATYTIGLNDKPLKKYYEKVRWIKEQRNNSAHINVSREPEVREVRDYIWESDFIDSLCEKPWES